MWWSMWQLIGIWDCTQALCIWRAEGYMEKVGQDERLAGR